MSKGEQLLSEEIRYAPKQLVRRTASGNLDIIDLGNASAIVVERADLPDFLAAVQRLVEAAGQWPPR